MTAVVVRRSLVAAALLTAASCAIEGDGGAFGSACDDDGDCAAGFACFADVCVREDDVVGEGEGEAGEGEAGEGEGEEGEGEGEAGEGEGEAGEGEGEGADEDAAIVDAACARFAECGTPGADECTDATLPQVLNAARVGDPACDEVHDAFVALLVCTATEDCDVIGTPESCPEESDAFSATLADGAFACLDGFPPPPPTWRCPVGFYASQNGCDCGCGDVDPDCAGGGCTEPGCRDDTCDVCRDSADQAAAGVTVPCDGVGCDAGCPSNGFCDASFDVCACRVGYAGELCGNDGSLEADYPLDGGEALDVSGQGRNAFSAQVQPAADRQNDDFGAVAAQNFGDSVELPVFPDFFPGAFSVAFWAIPFEPIGTQQDAVLLSNTLAPAGPNGGEPGDFFIGRIGAEQALFVAFGPQLITAVQMLDGWNHYAVVLLPDEVRVFVNGALAASNATPPGTSVREAQWFLFGPPQPLFPPFAGALDDVRIYSRVLDESEVLRLFNEPPR